MAANIRKASSPNTRNVTRPVPHGRAKAHEHSQVIDVGALVDQPQAAYGRLKSAGHVHAKAEAYDAHYMKVFAFLGSVKSLGRHYNDLVARGPSSVALHEFLAKGLPGEVLVTLVKKVRSIEPIDVGNAVGVSVRTLQRKSHAPNALLTKEQSGRTWKFAEILTKATDVFGSQSEAERWLTAPAMALDQSRPIDLLGTPVGVELVEQLLGRIEYGVYT